MGLADGPTEVHKVTVARQVLRDYQPSDDLWPTEWTTAQARSGAGEVRRVPRARGGEPVTEPTASTLRASPSGWTARDCPARASRSRPTSCPAARRTRSTEIRRGDCTLRAAHAAAGRPARPRQGHPAGVADHRGARRHRRAAHRGRRRVHRRVGARPPLLPDGLRRRLVADGPRPTAVAGAVRHRPRRAAGPGLPARRGHRAAVEGRLEGQGAAGPRPARRLPRAPGRPVDRLPRADQGPRDRRPRRGHRLAARAPAARLHPRPDARRLPVRQRDVPRTARRRSWPRSSTGRWARSATPSSTSGGWCRAGRRTPMHRTRRR